MTPLQRLAALAARPSLTAIGLLSGTSADGIDAAVVRVTGSGRGLRAETLGGAVAAHASDLRARILAVRTAGADEIALLHAELGERFAAAARAAIHDAGLDPGTVDLIGSHGQTVAHLPRGPCGTATLQIGCPARIAERTGIAVVSDFRARDVAAGGEGAPLVPLVDWLLLARADGDRLVQNLGGVGNVTLVTAEAADVRAFDTGPANGPLDAAARAVLGMDSDRGGAAAARGRPVASEVERLLAHPWFRSPPPRSLARETFAEPLVRALRERRPDLAPDDLMATLTEFVARSVVAAYRDHLALGTRGGPRVRDVVVSGGGVHNATLMRRLAALLEPLPVLSSAEIGVQPDLREAVAFAVLACEAVRGRPGNLPAVTGAAAPRVLGAFTPSDGALPLSAGTPSE